MADTIKKEPTVESVEAAREAVAEGVKSARERFQRLGSGVQDRYERVSDEVRRGAERATQQIRRGAERAREQYGKAEETAHPALSNEQSDRFIVPSRELTLQMLNVPITDWRGDGEHSSEEVLHRVTQDLRENLLATLADLAFAARERSETQVDLSSASRFSDQFVRELMRTLPIDPYVAPEVLRNLQNELLLLAQSGSVQASWGRLAERDGGLAILLPQRPAGAREPTVVVGVR